MGSQGTVVSIIPYRYFKAHRQQLKALRAEPQVQQAAAHETALTPPCCNLCGALDMLCGSREPAVVLLGSSRAGRSFDWQCCCTTPAMHLAAVIKCIYYVYCSLQAPSTASHPCFSKAFKDSAVCLRVSAFLVEHFLFKESANLTLLYTFCCCCCSLPGFCMTS